MEEERLECSLAICTLGWEEGHQVGKENMKIHSKVTTISEA